MKTKKQKKIGDVYEVSTKKGFAYFQYTHFNDSHGSLIRIIPGLFEKRPMDLQSIVNGQEIHRVFFPIDSALSGDFIGWAGNYKIPDSAKKFPIMRARGYLKKGSDLVTVWWFWDGEKEWKVDDISSEDLKSYPIRCVITGTDLLIRIILGEEKIV